MASAALEVTIEEGLIENSMKQGAKLRKELSRLPKEIIKEVRGKGLLNAIVINEQYDALEICKSLCDNGLLAKPTQNDKIRFAPPLIITDTQLHQCIEIISDTIHSFK